MRRRSFLAGAGAAAAPLVAAGRAASTAGLALGHSLGQAVPTALDYVHRALLAAPGLGGGHGPLNHRV